jgi:hypothetical protein
VAGEQTIDPSGSGFLGGARAPTGKDIRVKKALIVLALAATLSVTIAATAQAHLLSFQKAAAVARSVAQKDCNRDPDCTQYGALKNQCKRASAHRVRCYALNFGTDASGNYGCERPVLVKLKNDSTNVVYVTGNRTCTRL